jgi:hypothetical protein
MACFPCAVAIALIAALLLTPQLAVFAEEMEQGILDEDHHTPGYLTDEIKLPDTLPIDTADVAYLTIRRTGDNGIPATISNRVKISAVCEFINDAEYYVCSPEFRAQSGGAGGWSYWLQIYGEQDNKLFSYSGGAWPFYDGTDYYDLLVPDKKALDSLLAELYEAGDDFEPVESPQNNNGGTGGYVQPSCGSTVSDTPSPAPPEPSGTAEEPVTDVAPPDKPAPAIRYDDVSPSAWYSDAVEFVTARELMTGIGNNKFSPDAPVTRGMLITVLARLEKINTDSGETWYSKAAEWGVKNGLTDGENLSGDITREQIATLLYRYAKLLGLDTTATSDFADYDDAGAVSDWAADGLGWTVGAGLMSGRSETTLAPRGTATRAEVAAILERFVKIAT